MHGTLVVGLHPRAAKLEGGIEKVHQGRVTFAKCPRVKALKTKFRKDQIGPRQTIAAGKPHFFPIPKKEVAVIVITMIEVTRLAGPHSDRTKGDLAQTPNLQQDIRDGSRLSKINVKRSLGRKRPGLPDRSDIFQQKISRNRFCNLLK